MSRQFLLFVLTSGIAAVANIGSRILFSRLVAFEWAVVLAFPIGLLTAFVLARLFVFGSSGGHVGTEFYRFLIVNLVALVLVWAISVGLARILFPMIGFTWHAETVAHTIGVLAPAVTSFLGHKYYSFGKDTACL